MGASDGAGIRRRKISLLTLGMETHGDAEAADDEVKTAVDAGHSDT